MIHRLPFAALLLSSSLIATSAFAQDAAPAGGPANLCGELLAFVKKPEEKKQEAATPPAQATAISNSSGKSDAQPSASGGQPQQNSGLSGPVNAQAKAPTSDTRAPVSAGNTVLAQANAAAKSPAPPGAPAPSPKPDEALIARIDAAAAANDQVACRAAARAMRVAGVIMPPPLLALAALNPKFYVGTQP
ncbi:hypothetical protein [Methylobacterium sp. J-068]|uniref:hypothetical protein n=1 Tax=Methylobacterium sp. J-068 TaxID=2836649 RepID=UPI001FBBE27E|nr:hypothetical protein [Methylobacterium sp. J-068]MCJ2037340.1 hypothetical protein [Methylobacterium sp. J-068]